VQASIDLHRFLLVKALRYPLPKAPESETALWEEVSRQIVQGDRRTSPLRHE
jgi:hypothetical protein